MTASIRLKIGDSDGSLDDAHPHWIIGRDEAAVNLFAPDPTVSRRHCEVFLHEGKPYIRDMGSSNGTWVNGHAVDKQGVELAPNQQVFVGHMPLLVEWTGSQTGATVMGAVPAEVLAMIEARKQQSMSSMSTPAAPAPSSGGDQSQLTYRRQGSNNNGVLLIALPGESFVNDGIIKGYSEFTATDDERVDEITIELIEFHKRGRRRGHVWDRVIVKKGPWKTRPNDRVPMPFELRIPSATAMSDKNCHWEIHGTVDIAWAYDVEVEVPITMGNKDIDAIREAMGQLDLRVDKVESKPMGQQFDLSFEPPAQWRDQWNIDRINLEVQYLGSNLEIMLEVDKRGVFSKDRRTKYNLEIAQLRTMHSTSLAQQFQALIQRMLDLA